MTARRRLADRRYSELFTFTRDGARYTATISFFPGSKKLAEIFIDASKPGSAIAVHCNDAAVLASLLLQHGVTAAAIRRSITGPIADALAIAEGRS